MPHRYAVTTGAIALCFAFGCAPDSPTFQNMPADGASGDSAIGDSASGDSAVCETWSPAHFEPCMVAQPTSALTLDIPGTYTYDTTTHVLTDPNAATVTTTSGAILVFDVSVSMISATAVTIGRNVTLRVEGPRPLLIASWDTLTMAEDSEIAVNSQFDQTPGAGADPVTCAQMGMGQPGVDNMEGGSGGGGGGFGGLGGAGGRSMDGRVNGSPGGQAVPVPQGIRGGCPGNQGGNADGMCAGLGGSGGGALQLTARSSITVDGTLHAGGAGGQGCQGVQGGAKRCGGGSGGSGGMLGLDAPTITLMSNAVLAANGGGGGGGANDVIIPPGTDGGANDLPSVGSDGEGGQGGDGGDGGYVGDGDGQDGAMGKRGGGGGGGSAGFIIIRGTQDGDGAVISPDPMPYPG